MEPRLSLVTLGVRNLGHSVAFYRDGLGWPKSEVGGDEVAFFKTGGAIIALFPRTSFAADAGLDVDDLEQGGFSRFSLAHNVAEEEDVDSATRTSRRSRSHDSQGGTGDFLRAPRFLCGPRRLPVGSGVEPFLSNGRRWQYRAARIGIYSRWASFRERDEPKPGFREDLF